MDNPQKRIYEFGDFRVDATKRLLLKADVSEPLPLMPKAFDTLLYLVQNSGKVIGKDELMSAIWSDTIVEENNLTQNISALRRIFGEKPGEHRFIITVPGKGYKFVPEVREVFEEKTKEPEFTETDSETDKNQRPETENRKPLSHRLAAPIVFIVIALGAAAAAALGFYLWRDNKNFAEDTAIKTIAVLPFKPLVAENRNEVLEFGMADTLISKLSGGEIIVRPLGAVRRYNSLEQDSLIAGRELNAEAVLDGTIQTSDDRIRVSARLFRTADGKQLWAGQFDEKLTDIFTVQDSISERVASALKIRLASREKKRYTENVEAYQLYMKGRFHAFRLTRTETDKALDYFSQTIEIDPNYALAYVGQAETYLPMALTSGVPSWEVMPKAKASALKAIELDETLAEAHAVMGLINFWYDWDWQAAERHFLRALEIDPNSPEARFGYAHLLSNTLRHEKAIAEIRRAIELEPLTLRNNAVEGQILFFAGRYDDALDRLQKTIDLDQNFWLAQLFISRVYSEKGQHSEAIAAAKKAGDITGNSQSIAYRAYALAKTGKTEDARPLLDELLKLSSTGYVPPYNIAIVYNGLGEKDKALDYLEKGFTEKDGRMVFLAVEPMWDNLRNEPRFIDLMRRMNFE